MLIQIPDYIRDFILKLDQVTRAKVLELFEVLKISNYQIVMTDSKKVENDLFELKIKSAKHIRIFYTFYDNSIFFLHIIVKKSWKIPKHELEVARKRLQWLQRI